jgi:phosphatidylglycerol:prolipoprotein diacylglycerol transferase
VVAVVGAPALVLASIPSPTSPVAFELGPLAPSYYGLLVALGIVAATWLTGHELARKGYDGGYSLAVEALLFIVPLGLIGARISYVVANYDLYSSNLFPAVVEVWRGGLEVYGGLVGGFVGLLIFSGLRGIGALAFADAAAPGVVLGQAVGRWGDYFNQELFGRPSDLPWAIRIAPGNRPAEFADVTSFHPTFLYESIWDVLVCLILLWVTRRFGGGLREGSVFLLYAVLFTAGHLAVDALRLEAAALPIVELVRGNLLLLGGVSVLGFASLLVLRHYLPREDAPKVGGPARFRPPSTRAPRARDGQ